QASEAGACGEPAFLGPDDKDDIALDLRGQIVAPTPRYEQIAREAHALAPPLLRCATQRFVFIEDADSPGTVAFIRNNQRRDLVYLNASYPALSSGALFRNEKLVPAWQADVVHEMVHTAVHLLHSRSEHVPLRFIDVVHELEETEWSAQARALADETIARTRLEAGVLPEWERVHDVFAGLGWADPWYGDDWTDHDTGPTPGFFTGYGGEQPGEDIAEAAATINLAQRRLEVSGVTGENACTLMREQEGPGIRQAVAAVYTKAGFLLDLGFIHPAAYDFCVGQLRIQARGQGFFSTTGGQPVREYTRNMAGRLGRVEGRENWYLSLEAEGSIGTSDSGELPARASLVFDFAESDDVERVSFPRGYYRIQPDRSFSSLTFETPGDEESELSVKVIDAHLLFSRASHERVEGAIVVNRYQNLRNLLALPEAPDQPMVIFFRRDGGD
ncbi:MAG: hypothetical protein V2I57_01665, partial [Xanthomonadales bacterium]|nr:hypothetical protein [Xanthomonadales bacterium]